MKANVAKRKKFHDHPELLVMPEVRKLWQTEGLFSDHYLKARLKNNDWWPSDADARRVFQFCTDLYEKRAFALRRYGNEMGVRQEFIDKILERIGFAWSDNLRLPETKRDLEPDYILYRITRPRRACSTEALPTAIARAWAFWRPRGLGIRFHKSASISNAILISKSGTIYKNQIPSCGGF